MPIHAVSCSPLCLSLISSSSSPALHCTYTHTHTEIYTCQCRYILPSESESLPPIGYRPWTDPNLLKRISTTVSPTKDNDDREYFGQELQRRRFTLGSASRFVAAPSGPFWRFAAKHQTQIFDNCLAKVSEILQVPTCCVLSTIKTQTINDFLLHNTHREVRAQINARWMLLALCHMNFFLFDACVFFPDYPR